MANEAHNTAAIVRYLRRLKANGEPIWWIKIHGSPQQVAGVPDLLICHRGQFVALEIKSDVGRETKLQIYRIDEIHGAGGTAEVVRSVEDVSAILFDNYEPYRSEL